jgi:hypothetical protein
MFTHTKLHETPNLYSRFIMRREEVCEDKSTISLYNPDEIWNVGWGSIVDTATRDAQCGVRTLVEVTYFSLLQNIQTGSGTHPASFAMGTKFPSWGSFRQA